ncbi:BsaA family SipW-dependent biofilm matrix protein [Lachnospiraceae bacterium 62-35]
MKSKKKLIALAGVLGVAGIGGTLAYFNQNLSAENIFDTGKYDTELVEEFKPSEGENWEPGSTVNKDVTVQNTGTLPVVVRVKFQEKWVRRSDNTTIYEMDTTTHKSMLGAANPTDARNKFENVYQGNANDGAAGQDVDDSVVYKHMIPDGGWVYNPADGYYYYTGVLPGAKEGIISETPKLLDSVTLSENTDMGKFKETKYYSTQADKPGASDSGWIEFATVSDASYEEGYRYISTREMNERLKAEGSEITFMKSATDLISESLSGYSSADYTLTVVAQTVQATDQAVKAAFGEDLNFFSEANGFNWTLISEDNPDLVREDN